MSKKSLKQEELENQLSNCLDELQRIGRFAEFITKQVEDIKKELLKLNNKDSSSDTLRINI